MVKILCMCVNYTTYACVGEICLAYASSSMHEYFYCVESLLLSHYIDVCVLYVCIILHIMYSIHSVFALAIRCSDLGRV